MIDRDVLSLALEVFASAMALSFIVLHANVWAPDLARWVRRRSRRPLD